MVRTLNMRGAPCGPVAKTLEPWHAGGLGLYSKLKTRSHMLPLRLLVQLKGLKGKRLEYEQRNNSIIIYNHLEIKNSDKRNDNKKKKLLNSCWSTLIQLLSFYKESF